MSKPRTMYMHTLDGLPANYAPKMKYLHYAGGGRAGYVRLVPTLRQIQREWRETLFFPAAPKQAPRPRLGYLRVRVPA